MIDEPIEVEKFVANEGQLYLEFDTQIRKQLWDKNEEQLARMTRELTEQKVK